MDISNKFLHQNRVYNKQYSGIYRARLQKLRQSIQQQASKRWKSVPESSSVVNITKRCWIIGTLFRCMPLKPSILNHLKQQEPIRHKLLSPDDQIWLEDDLGRIKLQVNLEPLVTGVVCAVLGSENQNGVFEVEDVCYSELPIPKELKSEETWIAVCCGLRLSSSSNLFFCRLLFDYLSGDLGSKSDYDLVRGISHVFLMGNNAESIPGIQLLDTFIAECKIKVSIVPGPEDLATTSLPQQPINLSLFRKSKPNSLTNPFSLVVSGKQVTGSCGQNLNDLYRYFEHENRMEMAELLLKCRHLCPTAPDTLPCFPYIDDDPFVLEERPNIFICSNQPYFAAKTIEDQFGKILILLVPEFELTKSIVLVNTQSLETKRIFFK